MKPPTEYPES